MAYYGQSLGRARRHLQQHYELQHSENPLAPVMPGEKIVDSHLHPARSRKGAGVHGGNRQFHQATGGFADQSATSISPMPGGGASSHVPHMPMNMASATDGHTDGAAVTPSWLAPGGGSKGGGGSNVMMSDGKSRVGIGTYHPPVQYANRERIGGQAKKLVQSDYERRVQDDDEGIAFAVSWNAKTGKCFTIGNRVGKKKNIKKKDHVYAGGRKSTTSQTHGDASLLWRPARRDYSAQHPDAQEADGIPMAGKSSAGFLTDPSNFDGDHSHKKFGVKLHTNAHVGHSWGKDPINQEHIPERDPNYRPTRRLAQGSMDGRAAGRNPISTESHFSHFGCNRDIRAHREAQRDAERRKQVATGGDHVWTGTEWRARDDPELGARQAGWADQKAEASTFGNIFG